MICDAVLLYAPEDREAVESFKENASHYAGGKRVDILLYDDRNYFENEMHAVKLSGACLVYMTKKLIESKTLMNIVAVATEQSVLNDYHNVFPIYPEPKNTTFRVPMFLITFTGLLLYKSMDWFRNQFVEAMRHGRHLRETVRPALVGRSSSSVKTVVSTTIGPLEEVLGANDEVAEPGEAYCQLCTVNKLWVRVHPCGHTMCCSCFNKCLKAAISNKVKQTCPFCRDDLLSRHRVFVL